MYIISWNLLLKPLIYCVNIQALEVWPFNIFLRYLNKKYKIAISKKWPGVKRAVSEPFRV